MTPDESMTRPIGKILFWTARCVERVDRLLDMTPSGALTQEMIDKCREKESEFITTYRCVLRLRAKEVVKYCTKRNIKCTVEQVKENPFGVALAIDKIAKQE